MGKFLRKAYQSQYAIAANKPPEFTGFKDSFHYYPSSMCTIGSYQGLLISLVNQDKGTATFLDLAGPYV